MSEGQDGGLTRHVMTTHCFLGVVAVSMSATDVTLNITFNAGTQLYVSHIGKNAPLSIYIVYQLNNT